MNIAKRVFIIFLFMILFSSPLYLSSFAKNNKIDISSSYNQKYNINKINNLEIKTKFKIVDDTSSTQTLTTLSNDPNKKTYHIIQFKSALNNTLKLELEKGGVNFYSYIPDNSYFVKISNNQRNELLNYEQINWIGLYQPSYKLDSSLFDKTGNLLLIVELFDKTNKNKIQTELVTLGATIVDSADNEFKIFLDSSKLLDLSLIDDIMLIKEYQYPTILNDIARNITYVNYIWDNLGLFGQGEKIAIADTGLDTGFNDATMHNDFKGRIIDIVNIVGAQYSPADNSSDMYSGHGTHVAGIALGNGNLSSSNPSLNFYNQSFAGVAPKSSIYFQAMEGLCTDGINCDALIGQVLLFTPTNLYDLFEPANSLGVKIHSNSWGSNCTSDYDFNSVNTDSYVWNNSDMTILFAAGNEGQASRIYCPGTAKNVITIGSLQDENTIASYSSRGPVNDGRIKPDLVAPGSWIISTRSSVAPGLLWGVYDSNYLYGGGTSMATPHVAGVVALVREHFNKSLNYSTPSAALIKSYLINGAKDVLGTRPDFEQGWGMVDLKNTLSPDKPRQIFYFDNASGLATGENFIYDFDIGLNTLNPLKITLVWTDYPGSPLSGVNLVNDLDLTLNGPQNSIYYGNDFSSPYNTSYDRINNVESIDITNPIIGRYQLEVSGYNIVNGPQPFALVISYGKYSQQINTTGPIHNKIYNVSNITIGTSFSSLGYMNYSFNGELNQSLYTTDNKDFISLETFTFLDGVHTLDLYARNLSGFLTDHEQITFTVDTGPLNISSIVPNQNQVYSAYDFTLNLTLGEKGYLNFTLDNGLTNYTMNTTNLINYNYPINLSNGDYTLDLYAQDLVGNVNDTYQINFSIDKTIPTITINSPQSTTYDNSNLTASITINELGSAWYNLYGSNVSLNTSDNLTFTAPINNINDSYYTIHFYAKDLYNNYVYKNVSFGVDNITLNVLSYNNVSPINVTKLQVPLNVTFSKNISNIYYTHNGFIVDLNNNLNANILTTNISLFDYEQTSITLTYDDYFSNTKNTIISILPNLSLSDSITDLDNDGIINAQDSLNGDSININNNLENISVFVNSSNNLSKVFDSTYSFEIREDGDLVLEMINDFSSNSIDLTNVTIKKENKTNLSKMYVSGLQLESNKNKTMYLKLSGTNNSFSSLCIKDSNILDFSQVSPTCLATDETYIHSIPYSDNNYSIIYEDEPSKLIKISGLKHSAIVQTCSESWSYSDWGTCSGGYQGRTAIDQNSCGTFFQRDILARACIIIDSGSGSGSGSSSSSSSSSSNVEDLTSDYVFFPLISDDEFEVIKPRTSIRNDYDIFVGLDKADYDTIYGGIKKIYLKDKISNTPIVYFDYNLSKSELDLSDMEIYRGSELGRGYVMVLGLDLDGGTKTIKVSATKKTNKVCVKDLEITDISGISVNCDGEKEYIVDCNTKMTPQGYVCSSTGNYYSISGLKHSAIIEYESPLVEETITKVENTLESENEVNDVSSELSLSDDLNEDSNFWMYLIGIGLLFLTVFIIW